MPTPGVVTVCFYKGHDPASLLVRADTRRPGQAWSDVPSHCAVALPVPEWPLGWLYEYVSTGYHCRLATAEDLVWSYAVPVPDSIGAHVAAMSDAGRYDWGEIALFVLARLVPDRWIPALEKATGWKLPNHICSLFARSVLMAGGWPCPPWLAEQDCPASPNDLLFAVRETTRLRQTAMTNEGQTHAS